MTFYYDQFLNDPVTSMTLYAQRGAISEDGTPLSTAATWKPIGTSIISVGDSVSGSININWAAGSGNLIDSFMTGISEGTQQAMQLLGKMESMAKSVQAVLDKDREEKAKNSSKDTFLKNAQRKVYSASSFYPKYDGSEVSLGINPEFIFVTTSASSTALGKAKYMISYMSPEITDVVGGGALGIRTIYESPPNGYYNTQSGIKFNNYHGTFGLRIGTSAQFYPMLISNYGISVSTQRIKINDNNYTPLYVKVSFSMRPAGRFQGTHLYQMLTGDTLIPAKAGS